VIVHFYTDQHNSGASIEPVGSSVRCGALVAGSGVRRDPTRRSVSRRGAGSVRGTPKRVKNLMARLEEARGLTPTDFKAGIPRHCCVMNGSIVTKATTLQDSLTLRRRRGSAVPEGYGETGNPLPCAFSRLPRADERDRLLKFGAASPTTWRPSGRHTRTSFGLCSTVRNSFSVPKREGPYESA